MFKLMYELRTDSFVFYLEDIIRASAVRWYDVMGEDLRDVAAALVHVCDKLNLRPPLLLSDGLSDL